MKKPELLAPAGNLEKLEMVVRYGADAVYLAGKSLGLRAGADNFTWEEMQRGIDFAHENGVKVYVAVNIFAHNQDLKDLPEQLQKIFLLKADGIIVSDPGVFRLAREVVPELPVHISTQANITNWSSASFWQEMGARRLVLARDLSFEEIKEIYQRTGAELEVFVHGAMCISYSGRCLLSNYLTGRNANRGECAHPCRWKYRLEEEKRPGEFYPIEEDDRGSYIMNSKDLCLIEHLPRLIEAGVASFKIEGRMKSAYYAAIVTKAYREAIDCYFAEGEKFQFRKSWLDELKTVSHRHYTTGFAVQKPGAEEHRYGSSSYIRGYDFVGLVLKYLPETGEAMVEQRNRLMVGDVVEIVPPKGSNLVWKIPGLKNESGEPIETAPHPQQIFYMPVPEPVEAYSMIRRKGAQEKIDE